VAAAKDLLFEPMREELRRRVFITDIAAIDIVGAELGIWAGAIGAALWAAEGAPSVG
jgi:hypothetical protein